MNDLMVRIDKQKRLIARAFEVYNSDFNLRALSVEIVKAVTHSLEFDRDYHGEIEVFLFHEVSNYIAKNGRVFAREILIVLEEDIALKNMWAKWKNTYKLDHDKLAWGFIRFVEDMDDI